MFVDSSFFDVGDFIVTVSALVASLVGLLIAILALRINRKSAKTSEESLYKQKDESDLNIAKIESELTAKMINTIESNIGDIKTFILDSYLITQSIYPSVDLLENAFNKIQLGFIKLNELGKFADNKFLIIFSSLRTSEEIQNHLEEELYAATLFEILVDYKTRRQNGGVDKTNVERYSCIFNEYYHLIFKYMNYFDQTNKEDKKAFYQDVSEIFNKYKEV